MISSRQFHRLVNSEEWVDALPIWLDLSIKDGEIRQEICGFEPEFMLVGWEWYGSNLSQWTQWMILNKWRKIILSRTEQQTFLVFRARAVPCTTRKRWSSCRSRRTKSATVQPRRLVLLQLIGTFHWTCCMLCL